MTSVWVLRALVAKGMFLAAIAGPGCTSRFSEFVGRVVPSTEVATGDLRGRFILVGESGKATLSAQALFARASVDDTVVSLAGDDAVFCDGIPLARSMTFNGVDVPRKPAGSVYRFELRRAGGETVAVEVASIAEVTMVAPASPMEIRRRSPLTVQWTPAAATTMRAQLFSNCAITSAEQESERGSIELPPFEPIGVPGGPQNAAPPPCDGTLSLVRTRRATVTTALGKTEAEAEESQRLPVRVIE